MERRSAACHTIPTFNGPSPIESNFLVSSNPQIFPLPGFPPQFGPTTAASSAALCQAHLHSCPRSTLHAATCHLSKTWNTLPPCLQTSNSYPWLIKGSPGSSGRHTHPFAIQPLCPDLPVPTQQVHSHASVPWLWPSPLPRMTSFLPILLVANVPLRPSSNASFPVTVGWSPSQNRSLPPLVSL